MRMIVQPLRKQEEDRKGAGWERQMVSMLGLS
jgi:hypothetical protein